MESTIINERKSTHEVPVFIVPPLTKVENADTLSKWTIPGTDYTYVGKSIEWENRVGKLCAYLPPDSLAPVNRPEFAFLAPEAKYNINSEVDKAGIYARIKAKRLRGELSFGLCVPLDGEYNVGDNIASVLGVAHYDPVPNIQGSTQGGEVAKAPNVFDKKYDVDAFLKYGRKVFTTGEPVYITEKLEGENSKFVFCDGEMHCSSRNEWKKEWSSPPKITLEELIQKTGNEEKAKEIYELKVVNHKPKRSKWWEVLENHPFISEFCKAKPNHILLGEIYGHVKGFRYDSEGKIKFRAFDIMYDGKFFDADMFFETCSLFGIDTVPLLHEEPFEFDNILKYANQKSTIGNHIAEGVVITPEKERWDHKLGRVKLKCVNPDYLINK